MIALRWTIMATQVPAGGSQGGVVRYTMEMLRALAERDDVLVSAVTTESAAETVGELVGDAGRVYTIPNLPTSMLSTVERYLPAEGLRHGADVVHGVKHLLPTQADALRLLTVHDMLLLDRPQDFGTTKRRLLPAPYRASIRDADLLVCVSNATRRRLLTYEPQVAAKAEVVHLATSTSLRNDGAEAIESLGSRRFALVVGDPAPRKNLRTVVTAWTALRHRFPDVVLAIAGPPSWGETVVGGLLYRRLVEDGAIVPLGHVSDAQLRWAYERADVVLCPSLAEGFGLPAVEALEFGAPLLVSDDPALVEVSGDRARAHLPALDVDAWVAAVADVLEEGGRADDDDELPTARSWADVADETVAIVRAGLSRRRAV